MIQKSILMLANIRRYFDLFLKFQNHRCRCFQKWQNESSSRFCGIIIMRLLNTPLDINVRSVHFLYFATYLSIPLLKAKLWSFKLLANTLFCIFVCLFVFVFFLNFPCLSHHPCLSLLRCPYLMTKLLKLVCLDNNSICKLINRLLLILSNSHSDS